MVLCVGGNDSGCSRWGNTRGYKDLMAVKVSCVGLLGNLDCLVPNSIEKVLCEHQTKFEFLSKCSLG